MLKLFKIDEAVLEKVIVLAAESVAEVSNDGPQCRLS